MSNFEYKIIIDDLPQSGVGNGEMHPDLVVIHHSAFESEGDYNIVERLSDYASNHIERIGNPGLAYHFYIPRIDNDQNIYVTRYLNQIQWHGSNTGFNSRSIGVLIEGNFQTQEPTKMQLKKLKQLLDDLQNDKLFSDNPFIRSLKPADNTSIKTEGGITISGGLSYHNEIAEPGYGTECCGEKLIKYILEYRNTAGNVSWTESVNNLPDPIPTYPNDADNLHRELLESRLRVNGLEAENSQLKSEVDSLQKILSSNSDEVKNRLHKCENENSLLKRDLENQLKEFQKVQIENSKLDAELRRLKSNSLNTTKVSSNKLEFKDWKVKFIEKWNSLPVFVRYLIPNIISLAIPSIILYIQNFDLNSIEVLGVIGISHSAIKSLIIGYLKSLDKKLKGYVVDFEE